MGFEEVFLVIQIIGVLIPVIGIIALLRKEQSKTSAYLMITNIGCLLMNGAYFLVLKSATVEERLLALKMEYFGSTLFYFFFGLFIISYLRIPLSRWIVYLWAGIQGSEVFFLWNDNFSKIAFGQVFFRLQEEFGIYSVNPETGLLHIIRYCSTCIILLYGLIYTIFRIFRTHIQSERNNLARLSGAQFVVMIALALMLVTKLPYDIVPFFSALSILSIILSVIQGDFFSITDMGYEWVFEQMEEVFVIVDKMYGYLDSNTYARNAFPELKGKAKNARIPERLYRFFTDENEECEIEGKYYKKKITSIEQRGKIAGYSLLLTDVTRQHQLVEELKVEKDKADAANRTKSAFMSNMSHEIRTPMNAIVGMTEILLRQQLPAQETEYLNNIKNSGNALLSIINDILDFSKIESGKLEIIEDEYEPMSMLSDLGMIFLNRIGEKKIELLFDIDTELPEKLYGDVLRIRQIIINIVNNAIKFTDKGYVELVIRAEDTGGEDVNLQIAVKDTGQGIKKEDMAKLFGSFNQIDTKKNHNKEGTGLGLAISKQLVEMMGGSIRVESEYGKGSGFYLTVPQKRKSDRKAAQIKADKAVFVSGRMKEEKALDLLKKLADSYGIRFTDSSLLPDSGADFFFTDCMDLMTAEEREILKQDGTVVCLLQNPMADNIQGGLADIVINKPLYSLNFCQVINHDLQGTVSMKEDVLNFTAPDAKVLIVDDNEMNLKVALGLLEPLKMQLETAENGKQALKKICEKHYDLVFMDHMMPVMDGIEAVKELRRMEGSYYKNIPVVALTANAIVDAQKEFLDAGMNDFVAKPIKMKEICAKIKKWLPKEYIMPAGEAGERIAPKQAASAEKPSDPILEMEGLDVAEGIRNCGTKSLFISLLGDFYKLIDMKSAKLEKCLADGMIRDYTIEVHALKNTARMIGAMELSELFYRMEQYGNDGNIDALEAETPDVLKKYRGYKKILEPYGRMQEAEKKEIPKEEIVMALESLCSAIDNFDLDEADKIMKELENCRFPENCQELVEELRAYVADVAMEEILNVTGSLIQKLEEGDDEERIVNQ